VIDAASTCVPWTEERHGEDVVEFTCHGGLAVPARLLEALHAAGARPAAPGEFTRRAVLNGKLDLLQAEAVGDLIDASAAAQAGAALHQMEGGLSRRIAALREDLVGLEALLAYEVDFPERRRRTCDRGRIEQAPLESRQDRHCSRRPSRGSPPRTPAAPRAPTRSSRNAAMRRDSPPSIWCSAAPA